MSALSGPPRMSRHPFAHFRMFTGGVVGQRPITLPSAR